MFRSVSNWLWFVIAIAPVIAGCDSAPESDAQSVPAAAGTKVSLLKDDGQYALVRMEGSQVSREVYVPRSRLRQKGTLSDQQGTHTHVLTSEVAAYAETPPTEPLAPETRSREAIEQELRQLNRLFLTEKSHIRVIASLADITGKHPQPVHEATGELCWPAFECRAPDCPGRTTGDENYLFINSTPGTPNWCPECLKTRDPDSETPETRLRYVRWVRVCELPDTVARASELAAEMQRALKKQRRLKARQEL